MAKKTPPLLTKGRYQLKAPFSADATKIYICKAIRSFADIYELGRDVFTSYYEPKGLTQTEFEADRQEKANIITLMTESQDEVIYVPDTYILSYPNMNDISYSRIVLSLSFGALPDYLSLENAQDQIAGVASDIIGKEPDVALHKAPHAEAITPSEHETLEANRLAAIENRQTEYARIQELQDQNDALQQRVNALEQLAINNGLLE